MKKISLLAALLAAAVTPAFASAPEYLSIKEIAQITGMEVREVRMMTGAYSADVLYRTAFIRVSREWEEAVSAHGLVLEQVRDANGQLVEVRVQRPQHEV